MKNNFTTIILLIIMFILIVGIIIFGWAIYTDLNSNNSTPLVLTLDTIATEEPEEKAKKSDSTSTQNLSDSIQSILSENNNSQSVVASQSDSENNFFYNQLTDNQKVIYDGLNKNKANLMQGNYVINYGNTFSSLLTEEYGSDQLGTDYQTAIEAFTHDNADLFYLDVNKMYLNIETTTKLFKTTYNVYISAADNSTYFSDDFSSSTQVEQAMEAIETVKNNILNRLNGTDYQNILYIHDYLVDNIEYDSTYEATGSYSIYGALVGKTCVCEGYAKAFKYLTNAAGFDCEIMQGTATNSSGKTESHAWNCIKINGAWYEVDPTWDDPIIIGGTGKVGNDVKYKYFLRGTTTFEKDHVLSYQFSDGGKKFAYPKISKDDY
jgi:transglutaminase/protease-like cytokinesis protein 3